LTHFPAIWYILGHFGIFCDYLVYFHRFGTLYHEKIWQLCSNPKKRLKYFSSLWLLVFCQTNHLRLVTDI
jgi:hypothetical protein